MSFRTSTAYAKAMGENGPSIALVTGGRSGIGSSLARRVASFPFIDKVLAVSRSISENDVADISPKVQPLAADIGTQEGRRKVVEQVAKLCNEGGKIDSTERKMQLRFLVHSAGTINPIKNVLEVTSDELRDAMNVNCEAPFLLTTSLYPFMTPLDSPGVAGRILHVSSGAAHGAPPAGWGVYGISKAAFFQSYKVLEKEFRETFGGKVVVGSFRPGVVDTSMQGLIRGSSADDMPMVKKFQDLKEKANAAGTGDSVRPRPPPQGALDTPANVAFFGEFLLLGTTDEEFANKDASPEYDIRDKELFSKWIAPEDLE
jgi:NAD(P)-dependent dehydrogenase (short-subunit alcohol dehydrogenase family)